MKEFIIQKKEDGEWVDQKTEQPLMNFIKAERVLFGIALTESESDYRIVSHHTIEHIVKEYKHNEHIQ